MNIWSIYEITTTGEPIHGVMLRGRIRKLSLQNGFALLVENASDKENCVRFAVQDANDSIAIIEYVTSAIEGVTVIQVAESVQNPVLSKMNVNDASRYALYVE